ncbi:hypothetical protein [Rubrobacter aplysinae]|uniref:hypothetical protein n=1 Tax=Rubrobacter aplysinae TaxID=909625 RepID=UPI00064BFA55|nr:hypothetical protein [Rubrobacter aplysinae]
MRALREGRLVLDALDQTSAHSFGESQLAGMPRVALGLVLALNATEVARELERGIELTQTVVKNEHRARACLAYVRADSAGLGWATGPSLISSSKKLAHL